MRVDNIKVKKWKDLIDAFIRQYKFNMDVSLDRLRLQAMKKDKKESIKNTFKGGVKQPHMLILLCWKRRWSIFFINTFKNLYFEYLVGSSAQYFSNLVAIAERIKQAICLGRIVDSIEEKISLEK